MVGICAFASFAQNASAQNSHTLYEAQIISVPEDDTVGEEKKDSKSDENDFIGRMTDKVPFGNSLKQTWRVIDGDVDLYFEDLRVDRRNKVISYKIKSMPVVGDMDNGELKANVGKDASLTYSSDYIPFVGGVDGLKFQASTGTDDTNMSLRYKIDISW